MNLATLASFFATCSLSAQSRPTGDLAASKSYYVSGLQRNAIVGSSLVLLQNGRVVSHESYGLQNLSPAQPVTGDTTCPQSKANRTIPRDKRGGVPLAIASGGFLR